MRELLTNAADAVTARREIDAGADATIRISTDIDAQGRTVLEIVDSGVGLTADEETPSATALAVSRSLSRRFPNLTRIAMTLRESISASHNTWGAMLYDVSADSATFAPLRDGQFDPYQIKNIVDRDGAGDAFAAGLIFASNTPELSKPGDALAFATAASCLSHSIVGDANFASRSEIEALMGGGGSGRVVR